MVFYTLTLLGCLGVFLFGMKVLSDGIQAFAGDKMRQLMATMTQNRFSGVLTGFLATAVLQSSSATTVIVVSFVNASLLTLIESIGVIMGANLGTTVTAWIIAAVGKFSLADWAMPIIGVGLPCLFVGKGRVKSFGEVCIGFGLLFFGLGLLKDAVPDVKGMLASDEPDKAAQAQALQNFVQSISGRGYLSILAYLFIGILLTVVVQSSSAAMAITVTLAVKGWIGFHESCAIVLGENIGTTVTAYLASLGSSTEAKRAARAHFIFNVLGTLWMLVVFYGFTAIVITLADALPGSLQGNVKNFAAEGEVGQVAWQLAIFHTLFNFANICILIGFVPVIARLVQIWVKDDQVLGSHRLPEMTQLLGDSGELSLPQAEQAVKLMGKGVGEMMELVHGRLLNGPVKSIEGSVAELRNMEKDSDAMLREVSQYLVRCSTKELTEKSAATVGRLLRETSALEELADCLLRVGLLIEQQRRSGRPIPAGHAVGIETLTLNTAEILRIGLDHALRIPEEGVLSEARILMETLQQQRRELQESTLERLKSASDWPQEVAMTNIANELERIGITAMHLVESEGGGS